MILVFVVVVKNIKSVVVDCWPQLFKIKPLTPNGFFITAH